MKDTYTYDGMKSPLYHCKTPKWFLGLLILEGYFFPISLKNNPTQEISVEGAVAYKSDIVYKYDDDGYPITATVKTTAMGRTETANISFTYITK